MRNGIKNIPKVHWEHTGNKFNLATTKVRRIRKIRRIREIRKIRRIRKINSESYFKKSSKTLGNHDFS